jgi:hypothetical protein
LIRKYQISKNTTITNCYRGNMDRATGSNSGFSDSLELFKISGGTTSGSRETARILVDYSIDDVKSDFYNNLLPTQSSMASAIAYGPRFSLRLYDVPHALQIAEQYRIHVSAVDKNWDEGQGIDLDSRMDDGCANWYTASVEEGGYVSAWTIPGVSCGEAELERFVLSGSKEPDYYIDGHENLVHDVTSYVYRRLHNNELTGGFIAKLEFDYSPGSDPSYSNACSYSFNDTKYTKRFSSRSSEFFLKRPVLQAAWDDSIIDARGEFWCSASDGGETNSQVLAFYNYKNGAYRTVGSTTPNNLYVQIWTDPVSGSAVSGLAMANMPSVGIYTASLAIYSTSSMVYDRWFDCSTNACYFTGSVVMKRLDYSKLPICGQKYRFTMPELHSAYGNDSLERFIVQIYDDNYEPNNYAKIQAGKEVKFLPYVFYKIIRQVDGFPVLDYGTGSYSGFVSGTWNPWPAYCMSTRLSQEASGNYFLADMSLFEPDYMYQISYLYGYAKHDPKLGDIYLELEEADQKFSFRVEGRKV